MDAHHLVQVQRNPKISDFGPGDTVQVNYRVVEGERVRLQPFQGVVLLRRGGKGAAASFTVRRITHGLGVERSFPLHSPHIDSVEVLRYGKVRRARLYYLRGLAGRAARIKERPMASRGRAARGAAPAPTPAEDAAD